MQPAPLVTSPVAIFFIVLAIIVLAPVIFNRLKIPHIVGMIIAGVIVGPYGFNVLADDSSFIIFGQVGLLYLMFLAGLEIDMYHLKLNFKRGTLFGVLTFIIPLILGIIVSYYILSVELITSFLLGSMFAAHTLISYPVAARFGVTKSPSVLISVVGTIFAVAGSLFVLATVTDIARSGVFEPIPFILLLVKIAIYVIAILWIYPLITRFFLKLYSDRVTQFVFILTLVFLSALVAEKIGLSSVLGAFLAGMVLNRYVPTTSPLMGRIEFVGNSIFIPYFLISVGMMVNLKVLGDWPTLLIAAIMLSLALFSKWLPAVISQYFYKMSGAERSMMFGLTTAHTAVALAVVTIGYNIILPNGERMLGETILNATILVILVTCALAPIITSNAARTLRIEMLEEQTKNEDNSIALHTKSQHLNVLLPVSNPITAQGLMELALLLSGHQKKKKDIHTYLLHVRNDNGNKSRSVGRNSIELAAKAASAVDVETTPVQRFDVNSVTGIINFINERDINVIVVGMHRRTTVVDSFLGPKIEQLIKMTRQMIVVSRCYAPLNTISSIYVYAPASSYLEVGFNLWVDTVANLAQEIGCRITFCCNITTVEHIENVLKNESFNINSQYIRMDSHDEFIVLSKEISEEDLLIWISSRPHTVSHTKEQTEIASFISHYLQKNNMLIIYPEISTENKIVPSFATPFD